MTKIAKQAIGTRRKFSAEFKHEAVRRMAERRAPEVKVKQIGRELDVRPEVLSTWKRQLEDRPGVALTNVFTGHAQLPSEQDEVRRLQREVHRLKQEDAFLKSAAAYFAKESRPDSWYEAAAGPPR